MSDQVPPTPEPSHWGGIHRSGASTGMPRNPFSGITRTVTGRRLLLQVSLVVSATIGGYLVAAFWFSGRRIFTPCRTVACAPNVLSVAVAVTCHTVSLGAEAANS